MSGSCPLLHQPDGFFEIVGSGQGVEHRLDVVVDVDDDDISAVLGEREDGEWLIEAFSMMPETDFLELPDKPRPKR